jgi:DNA-binding MarR family transcriptional regulator
VTVQDEAAQLAADLSTITRVLRNAVWEQARSLPTPLTAPQLLALRVLVDETRDSGDGLSLSELSKRMGLTHSTVSGIVTRLEGRNLVRRSTRSDDRRYVTIELTAPVRDWLERNLPAARAEPLAQALSRATKAERKAILDGVATLARLVGG